MGDRERVSMVRTRPLPKGRGPSVLQFFGTSYLLHNQILYADELYVRKCARSTTNVVFYWSASGIRTMRVLSTVRRRHQLGSTAFQQQLCRRPNSNVRLRAGHRPRRSVRRRPVQSFIFDWSLPIRRFKDAFIYADREEGRTRSHRRLFLPANFQSSSAFQTPGTARRPSDYGVLDVGRAVSTTAIRHPPWTLA